MKQQIYYEDCLHNYNSDCCICKEDNDDNNIDDEYNKIQDTKYYDNASGYNYNNTDNNNKTK